MNPDFLERVKAILERAMRVEPAVRAEYLQHICASDAALFEEALSLLPHYESMQQFEPQRPNGSLWRLPGTTTLSGTDDGADADADFEPVPPFCLGQYRIDSILGRGGMGVVYRGVHATLRREVAIKLLRRAHLSPEHQRQFALEAEILRRLRHPGIARLVYADTVGSSMARRPYFVMECVTGLPLTKHASANALSVGHRLVLLAKVCEAMAFAHDRGIVHCDLKPGNILISSAASSPKILDFGVARIVAFEAACFGPQGVRFMGTPDYASPEQLCGELSALSAASDVYSLGVITAELLTGELPTRDKGRANLHLDAIHAESVPGGLGKLREFVHHLEKLLTKALAHNPANRFESAVEIGRELERLAVMVAPLESHWSRFKNRVMRILSPQSEPGPSTLSNALKVVTGARIARALESPGAADPARAPRPAKD